MVWFHSTVPMISFSNFFYSNSYIALYHRVIAFEYMMIMYYNINAQFTLYRYYYIVLLHINVQ